MSVVVVLMPGVGTLGGLVKLGVGRLMGWSTLLGVVEVLEV